MEHLITIIEITAGVRVPVTDYSINEREFKLSMWIKIGLMPIMPSPLDSASKASDGFIYNLSSLTDY